MSALVTSDKDEDWFTNSCTRLTILGRAFNALPPERHDEHEGYDRAHLADLVAMLRRMATG